MSVSIAGVRLGGGAVGPFTQQAQPRVSWRLQSDECDVVQRGYEIERAADAAFTEARSSTGYVVSDSPLDKEIPGEALRSREPCWIRVRAETSRGATAWSASLRVDGALLTRDDWQARPISPFSNIGVLQKRPPPLFRRAFQIDANVVAARLYISALGVYEAWINGERVSAEALQPGWTVYKQRLLYNAYDVTEAVKQGENVIAAIVGDGWWRGNLTWLDRRAVYGDTTALLAQLEVTLADGRRVTVASDDSWLAATGALRTADIYDGVDVDLACEPVGWRSPGFKDASWERVTTLDLPEKLVLSHGPGVGVVRRLPCAVRPRADGVMSVDCGQNVAGWLSIRASGPAGAKVRVRHAEVLDESGALYVAPLRSARAADVYALNGNAAVLAPSFTYHGFRYAEIEADEGVDIRDVEAVAISSDGRDTGEFACSNELLNKLFANVRWSQRGNFVSIPTDCPQRDERLGWTGDIQVFAQTACANGDVQAFLASWLADLALEQREDGCVPGTAPNILQGHKFEYVGAGWGDAATLAPWAVYEAYGDAEILRGQYASMRAWVDWCSSRCNADGAWVGDWQIGDWLDPNAPSDRPEQATTNSDYVATCYLVRSAAVLSRAAAVLCDLSAQARYADLSQRAAAAAWRTWGDHAVTTQTGCALALEFGVAPPEERGRVADALAELTAKSGGRIGTGFLGTPLVLPALSNAGHIDAAYRVLLNETCPGWLFQVAHGATTMWERWDAIQPGGHIHDGKMSSAGGYPMLSFNHYAYGAVGAWLYRAVAGIAPGDNAAGYGEIIFAPTPGGDLTWARAAIDTPYGKAAIAWRLDDEAMSIDLETPPGAEAWFCAPTRYDAMWIDGARVDLVDTPHPAGRRGVRFGSGQRSIRLTRSR